MQDHQEMGHHQRSSCWMPIMPRLEGSLMLQIYTEILVLLCMLTLPAIQQNFTRAYQQSVVANDRIHKLNYAKAVSCLRLITVVKVRGPAALCKSALLYIYMSVVHEYKLDVDAHNNNNYYNEFELLQCHIIHTHPSYACADCMEGQWGACRHS